MQMKQIVARASLCFLFPPNWWAWTTWRFGVRLGCPTLTHCPAEVWKCATRGSCHTTEGLINSFASEEKQKSYIKEEIKAGDLFFQLQCIYLTLSFHWLISELFLPLLHCWSAAIHHRARRKTYLLHYSEHRQTKGRTGEIDRVRQIALTREKRKQEIYCFALGRKQHNSGPPGSLK